ncbi:5-(carboxyamino)imidazole ribonucleotide synthase [Niallia nealsonii]|uniref:N5-carboxyaminoimidazole ribonucleotide synthase n=1 Tax=Niallia nealsonii TaxID=115979 RepID=A0A2N0Z6L8_9BACI|nr:5-(carboxyamino)imidazole ribonucleotide synthase [Niallia nealsonii]
MSNSMILPGQTIGIIGGGQLGRMMALAAKAQGFRIAVLDPVEDSPCGQVADYKIVDAYDSITAIQELSKVSDVITYEFENIDAAALDWLKKNANVPQGSELLEITQDRIKEKQAIEQAGVKVAPYKIIEEPVDIREGLSELGYPAVLKTARGGYDGKGQYVIKESSQIEEAELLLNNGPCVLESWIPFEKEISVIVTRSQKGENTVFPVSENIHINNILHESIVPARITEYAKELAIEKANKLAEFLNLTGTLAVEMFLAANDEIYINELAPRPHNSGHYTIEACETSQFEQHIRAICNWPLASTRLLRPAVMVNILGEHQEKIINKIGDLQDWKIHLYGKEDPKEKRKMGHATLLRSSVEIALDEIENTNIWNLQTEKIGG